MPNVLSVRTATALKCSYVTVFELMIFTHC